MIGNLSRQISSEIRAEKFWLISYKPIRDSVHDRRIDLVLGALTLRNFQGMIAAFEEMCSVGLR